MSIFFGFRRYRRRRIRILVIQGGNNAEIVRYPHLCDADIVIVLDAENEIRRLFPGAIPNNFKIFCLGRGQTARTLAENASDSIRRCLANTAGMNADSGLGQLRGIGWLATRRLLGLREVQAFFDHELVDHLMQVSGGVLEHVDIDTYGSVAGGTASAEIVLTHAAVERTILGRTNSTVRSVFHISGGISYTGLGERIYPNTAAGTVEVLAHVICAPQDNRAVRAARFSELPPVGEDRAERARYMLEVEQASQSAGVCEALDRANPNRSQDGRLGNVTLMQSGHFTPLHPRFDVAHDIAPGYARTLRQMVAEGRPHPSLVQKLALNTRRQELPRESLESILDTADSANVDDLIAALTRPARRLAITVDALLATGEAVHLSDASTVWATSPGSLAETSERLILQNTCLQALEREIAALEGQCAEAENQARQLAGQIARTISSRRHPSIWTRITQLFNAPTPLSEQLAIPADELRRVMDGWHEHKHELDTLKAARSLVESERDLLVRRFLAIAVRLESAVPRGQQRRNQPTVVARPIDSVFRDLCELTIESPDDTVSRILLSAVDHVTVPGLAKITGANLPRLEVIAFRIAQCQFEPGPSWGGKDCGSDGSMIHVLPPLSQETGDKLKELIRSQGSTTPVVVAERMPASLNCTTLIFTPVKDLEEDIFTQLIKSALLAAYHDPNRDMYFPSGTDALKKLGITIDGQVHFDPLTDQENVQ